MPMTDSTESPRRTGLASTGLVFALTSFIPANLLAVLPLWTCSTTERIVRVALVSGSLLWLAAAFVLPAAALLLARRAPERYTGAGRARVALAVAVLVSVVVSIVMPRGHAPNWGSYAVGQVRSFVSAEGAFLSSNGQVGYGTLECLLRPAECIPGYTGPEFLSAEFLLPERTNYRFTFYPGPPADATLVREKGAAPRTVQHFAYVAEPLCPEASPRSFCGNEAGFICYAWDGAPQVKDGRCPEACEPL